MSSVCNCWGKTGQKNKIVILSLENFQSMEYLSGNIISELK